MGQRDILILISDLLLELKIPYLLTGSFASSIYGFPRATHDIDFVIEIESADFPKLANSFIKLEKDFLIDFDNVKESIDKCRHFEVFHLESSVKVDFWPLKKSEFNRQRLNRKKQKNIFGKKLWLVSPEDLILAKLLFCKEVFSEKHMMDCAGIWKVQGDKLDSNYLTRWAKRLKVEKLFKEIKETEY